MGVTDLLGGFSATRRKSPDYCVQAQAIVYAVFIPDRLERESSSHFKHAYLDFSLRLDHIIAHHHVRPVGFFAVT